MAGTYSLKRFPQKTPGTEKHKDKIKSVIASLRCHGDSDCIKTQIKKFSSLYNTVVVTFPHISTHADVVNAQTWEVYPPKNPAQPP